VGFTRASLLNPGDCLLFVPGNAQGTVAADVVLPIKLAFASEQADVEKVTALRCQWRATVFYNLGSLDLRRAYNRDPVEKGLC
jgi:hypothetical protein